MPERADGVCVVAATKYGQTELWAAATPRDEALAEVQQLLGPEWAVQRITPETVTALALHPGGVRPLESTMTLHRAPPI